MTRRRASPVDRRLLEGASWLPVPADPGSSFSFRHIRARKFPFPFHYHPEVELTCIVRGTGRRVVGEVVRPYRDGDLVLIGSMLPHVWMSDASCDWTEAFVLRFDRSLIDQWFAPRIECAKVLDWIRQADRGLECPRGLPGGRLELFSALSQATSPSRRLLGFLELIFTLSEAQTWKTICGAVRPGGVGGSGEQRIGYALRYMREHFCDGFSQAEVAAMVGMGASAFSRLFRRISGQTFQSLLASLRLDHACRLLSGTSLSVAEVCFAAGFRNLSNFNKQFLAAKGMSPRRFRRQVRDFDRSEEH